MSHRPERRHTRSDDDLRREQRSLKREWEAQTSAGTQEKTMPKAARRRTDNIIAMPTAETLPASEPRVLATDGDIARRAYELYVQRGGEHGHDVDDWLRAERELRGAQTLTAA